MSARTHEIFDTNYGWVLDYKVGDSDNMNYVNFVSGFNMQTTKWKMKYYFWKYERVIIKSERTDWNQRDKRT